MLSSRLDLDDLSALASFSAAINTAEQLDMPMYLGTTKAKAAEYVGAQPSFKMKKQGQTYPFSNTRQDERQRRQFSRAETKREALLKAFDALMD